MNSDKPEILIVDNYDSFTYNLVQIIEGEGSCRYRVVKNDRVVVGDAGVYDGILFSPGPGVPSGAPVMGELLDAYQSEKSFLGICLGHQAIAEHFGATVENMGRVYHGLTARVSLTDSSDYLFRGIPDGFSAGLYHSWAVRNGTMPDPLKMTSVSDDGIIMSLSHRQWDVKGVQYHPESYMTLYGRQIIKNWLDHLVSLKDAVRLADEVERLAN